VHLTCPRDSFRRVLSPPLPGQRTTQPTDPTAYLHIRPVPASTGTARDSRPGDLSPVPPSLDGDRGPPHPWGMPLPTRTGALESRLSDLYP
jgi:hypothetical protein